MMEKAELDLQMQEFAAAGVEPFERTHRQAYKCASGSNCARFSLMEAHTPAGILPPEVYIYPTDKTQLCIRLFEQHLSMICRELAGAADDTPVTWLYAPPRLLALDRAGRSLKKIFSRYACTEKASKVCLAFPSETLWLSEEELARLDSVRRFGCRTAITDVGDSDCPVTALSKAQFDAVSLHPLLTEQMKDSAKRKSVAALVAYIKTCGCEVYVPGITKPEDEVQFLYQCGADAYWLETVGDR